MSQTPADAVQGEDAVENRRGRTDGNQRIHVGCAGEQRAKADDIIAAVEIDHRQRQQKLRQRKGGGILRAVQKMRQRQADHVSHRDIH